MTLRRIRRSALVVILLILFAQTPAAHATWTWNAGHTSQGFRCSWAYVELSGDWGKPGLWTKATADASVNNWCDDPTWRAPAGTLAVAQDLIAWTANNGWFLCNPGPWFLNDWASHEWNTSFAWGARPCGSAWFYGRGYSAVSWGGRWHGHLNPINTIWIQV